MYADKRKIQIIEAVLKVEDEQTLAAIEQIINKGTNVPEKRSAREFLGIWSEKEAAAIEKFIEEDCEQIHPDDWK